MINDDSNNNDNDCNSYEHFFALSPVFLCSSDNRQISARHFTLAISSHRECLCDNPRPSCPQTASHEE